MTFFKRLFFILTILALTLNSCGIGKFSTNHSIQKRKYTKGWFIKKSSRPLTSSSSESSDKTKSDKLDSKTENELVLEKESSELVKLQILEVDNNLTVNLENDIRPDIIPASDNPYITRGGSETATHEFISFVEDNESHEKTKSTSYPGQISKSKKSFILFIVFGLLAIVFLILLSLDSVAWGLAILVGGVFLLFMILSIVFAIKALVDRRK